MKRQPRKYLIILGVLVAFFLIYSTQVDPASRPVDKKVSSNPGDHVLSPLLTGPINATLLKFSVHK